MYGGNRNDLGRPVVAPTDEIYVDAFGYRPNKDFYVALHNKKETRGGLSVRVFLHRIDIKLQIGDIATDRSIPNSRRKYRLETYQNP